MLNQTKSYVKKIKHNLNLPFPLENNSADIVISLFTLLHIDNLQNFFEEVYRILKEGGTFILFHHIERKNYVYKQ
jgi:ubiquinone/menaquinone biosynthesis C-methylase UbiE